MCHGTNNWTEVLPIVRNLGLRTSYKKDIEASAAEMTYENFPVNTSLKKKVRSNHKFPSKVSFTSFLKKKMRGVRSSPIAYHNKTRAFAHKILYTYSHVFIKQEATQLLEQPYR